MITYFAIGIGFLIAVAVVVGISDAAQAGRWRQTARERRERWEARQRRPYDRHDSGEFAYAEEDDD